MFGKLLLVAAVVWMGRSVTGSSKTRSTEDRLNTAMPRIPWPQPYDGPAGNSSYPPGNSSYTSGNSSYPTGAGVSGSDTTWSSNQGSGTVNPWPHAHTISHSHNLGTFQSDFNVLRQSYSDTVSAFNAHIGDHGALVTAVQVLRADHSNLLNAHNGLMFRLNATKILQ